MDQEMSRSNKEKWIKLGKNIGGASIIPLICLVVSIILPLTFGTQLFVNATSWEVLIYGIVFQTILAFAVSINLHSGRFDFSVGAMLTVTSTTVIVLSRVGVENLFVLLLISVAVGIACGLISGLLYILLKLPSMIISLGCALLFEAIAYIITGGKSVSVLTGPNGQAVAQSMSSFLGYSGNPIWIIIIGVVIVAALVILFNFTKFGHDYHALQFGQKIAVSTGIKEVKNALICYLICGALVGVCGMLYGCNTMSTSPDKMLNFSTVPLMFGAFCPLFFADFIRRYTKKEAAIFIGVISYQFIQLAFGNMSSINTKFTSTIYGIINSLILVVFLIYLNNEKQIFRFFKNIFKKKKPAQVEEQ